MYRKAAFCLEGGEECQDLDSKSATKVTPTEHESSVGRRRSRRSVMFVAPNLPGN